MDHESDSEESKKEYEMTQSKYKIEKMTATATKLRNTTVKKKKNIHKKGQDASDGDTGEKDGSGLEPTADDIAAFGTGIEREAVMLMTAATGNKLYHKLLQGAKRKPRGYSKTERWDRPLAKAPGGRSFETDSNAFLRLITKDLELEVTRHEIEAKVREVSRQAGMLAFSNEGERARMFCMETAVSHPFVLLADSWDDRKDLMVESNATRVFWTIDGLTGHQWASQIVKPPPMRFSNSSPPKPKSALKTKPKGETWAKVATDPGGATEMKKKSVRVDEAALKAKLRQVKITGSKNIHSTFFSITLTLPKASDPPMKFVEIAQDLVKELMTVDDTVVIYPYMAKNRLKKTNIADLDEIPKAPGVWNTYFERMFPLKKEGAKIYTGMLVGHDVLPEDLAEGIMWWTMSNDHYFHVKNVQAEKTMDCLWLAYSPSNWEPQTCADAIMKELNYKYQVGCREKRINSGKAYNAKDKSAFAMHMEVAEQDFGMVFKEVTTRVALGASRKHMPLMIEMRAVPDLRALQKGLCGLFSDGMVSNCRAMMTKQGDFKRNSSQMTSWSFDNPDFIPPGMSTPKSLRMIIYELKYDGKPLFHALTPEKSGIGQVFTFHNKHEHHARMMIMGMYVFVEHHYKGQGRKWFKADAIALAEGSFWDPGNGVIVTPQDHVLQAAAAEDWWETDDLVTGEHVDPVEERPTRRFEQPAITADPDMMEYKNDGGETVASFGKRRPYTDEDDEDDAATATAEQAVEARDEEKSVSAVTWDSDPTELQAKLAATEEKLRRMEEQLRKANVQSAAISELDPEGQLVTPPPNKTRNTGQTSLAGAPTGAGRDD
jgi:hypothetical protein